MLLGDAELTAGQAGLGLALITAVGGAWKLYVDSRKERDMKRDSLEFDAKFRELEDARDDCMERHAEKDVQIGKLEQRLDECQKDHRESQKDRERMWEEIRGMKAGPV